MSQDQYIRSADLGDLARRAGVDQRIVEPDLAPRDPVLAGRFLMLDCRSGISVHATDARELHDLTIRMTRQPAITVFVVLDGELGATLDRTNVEIGGSTATARALVWSVAEPVEMVRHSRHGTHVRKVTVTVPLHWFDDNENSVADGGAALRQFARQHLATRDWVPSRRACRMAAQIIAAQDRPTWLRDMQIESRALEIVAEAMGGIAGTGTDGPTSPPRTDDAARVQRARDYIADNPLVALSLSEIARAAGASPASLQRAFKRTHGTTVIEFVRECRLHAARDALEREGISIAEAAYLSGYATPSSFSTAFKRQFGIAPGTLSL